MKLLPLLLLAATFSSSLAFADSAATVKPLPFDDFKRIAGERSVTIDASTKTIIFEFANGFDPIPPKIGSVVSMLRADAKTISLSALMSLLEPKHGQAVSEKLTKHDDPMVRFVAGIVLSGSGVSNSAKAVHALIHDESLSLMDKRLIRTWCDGVGIRAASDNATRILDHLTTAMGGKPKFKKGDAAPTFEAKTTTGHKLSSRLLRGKVVVLHFWSTSCGPCIGKMPSHIKALSEYKSDAVEIIFVSLDEDKKAFDSAILKHSMPFKNVREARGWGGKLARAFGINSIPFDVVIGRDGKVFSNSIEDIDAALAEASTPLQNAGRAKR